LERINQTIYVSATPGEFELERAEGRVVELIIRPTGLVDPVVEVRPTRGQVEHLLSECKKRIQRNERVLVTTLTKRMAEDLTDFLNERGVLAKYMHSDIDTLERISIIQELREGKFYVLVGINLLREGLDIPEVSLVAILDADKEGFLRSTTSLIQTFGRAARNVNGMVIMYADTITKSMQQAIYETNRRRKIQIEFNKKHGIVPTTIKKSSKNPLYEFGERRKKKILTVAETKEFYYLDKEALSKKIRELEKKMKEAAKDLEFERAAEIRDELFSLKEILLNFS